MRGRGRQISALEGWVRGARAWLVAHLLHGSGVVPYTGTFGVWQACHMAPFPPYVSCLMMEMVMMQVRQIPKGLVSVRGAVEVRAGGNS